MGKSPVLHTKWLPLVIFALCKRLKRPKRLGNHATKAKSLSEGRLYIQEFFRLQRTILLFQLSYAARGGTLELVDMKLCSTFDVIWG